MVLERSLHLGDTDLARLGSKEVTDAAVAFEGPGLRLAPVGGDAVHVRMEEVVGVNEYPVLGMQGEGLTGNRLDVDRRPFGGGEQMVARVGSGRFGERLVDVGETGEAKRPATGDRRGRPPVGTPFLVCSKGVAGDSDSGVIHPVPKQDPCLRDEQQSGLARNVLFDHHGVRLEDSALIPVLADERMPIGRGRRTHRGRRAFVILGSLDLHHPDQACANVDDENLQWISLRTFGDSLHLIDQVTVQVSQEVAALLGQLHCAFPFETDILELLLVDSDAPGHLIAEGATMFASDFARRSFGS